MEIKLTKTTNPKQKPDENNLGFGVVYTDHMFTMKYSQKKGWHNAEILPYAPLLLQPSAMVFHYAQECFEGLKAYRTQKGEVQLFRPNKNAQRMMKTHERLCIPQIPEEIFVQAVSALVEVEKDFVPSAPNTSLYIRPCTIATQAFLGVAPSEEYLFFIICSPSGAYYAQGLNPVKIYVEDEMVRASQGGTGHVKCGGNYAASLAAQEKAEKLGYGQVLWLDGLLRKYVEEVGSMNCFFKINGEIITAPTTGTVLPGVTRMSCIELLKEWGFTVKEKLFAIDDLMKAAKNKQLEEIFGTGTAAVICPVGAIYYKGEEVTVQNGGTGEVTKRLYDTLTDIQWGRIEDAKNWVRKIK